MTKNYRLLCYPYWCKAEKCQSARGLIMQKSVFLEQLYKEYYPLMYYTAFNILRDHNLAEDAVHEAFLKLTKKSFMFEKIKCKKTAAFMVIIVRNIALTMYKYKKKEFNQRLEDNHMAADPGPTPLEMLISNINIEKIKEAIKAMDANYADILILKYHYECSNKQIAELLSLSEENVRVRLHRTRKKLAAILKDEVQV